MHLPTLSDFNECQHTAKEEEEAKEKEKEKAWNDVFYDDGAGGGSSSGDHEASQHFQKVILYDATNNTISYKNMSCKEIPAVADLSQNKKFAFLRFCYY